MPVSRQEFAMKLLEAYERVAPEDVHYFNPYFEERETTDDTVREALREVCKPWSYELYLRGEYSPVVDDWEEARKEDEAARYRDLRSGARGK